jgi:hypothetical protein
VIVDQQNYGADHRDEKTIKVESTDAAGTKDVEYPATRQRTQNAQKNVDEDTLTLPVYDLAGDEPGNETKDDPDQE